jgi:hypothetical protein
MISVPRREGVGPPLAPVPGGPRRSPWIVGIVVGLVLMVVVNLVFIYIAVSDADAIVPSYHLEHR